MVLLAALFWLTGAEPAGAAVAGPASFSATPKAKVGTTTTFTLTWAAVPKAYSYTIQSADFVGGRKAYTVYGTSFTTPALTAGNKYFFRIRAFTTSGYSTWSTIMTVTP